MQPAVQPAAQACVRAGHSRVAQRAGVQVEGALVGDAHVQGDVLGTKHLVHGLVWGQRGGKQLGQGSGQGSGRERHGCGLCVVCAARHGWSASQQLWPRMWQHCHSREGQAGGGQSWDLLWG